MSDTQFSSLSPNSSYDLDIGNHYLEETDLYDQETASIDSIKGVANLDDFDDMSSYKIKVDPFLSDFMKDDNDDVNKLPTWCDSNAETSDMNIFFGYLNADDLDDYISNGTGCLDEVTSDLLDWDPASPTVPLSAQKQTPTTLSNKRAFSPVNHLGYVDAPLPSKQRKVEVSSHIRCDEWINKYHETTEKCSLKASGMLDRRKTKHHKVLSEYDAETQVENTKRNKDILTLERKSLSLQDATRRLHYQKIQTTVPMSTFPNKYPTIHTSGLNRNVSLKPPMNCKRNTNIESHIMQECKSEPSINNLMSSYHSPDLNRNDNSTIPTDVAEMSRIPSPLRMGKRVSRRGHRLSLWQFLMCLLDSSKYREHSTGIKWLNRNNGVFHIIDSKQVATLWGQYKERRDKMTYDSLARSLRHYYKKNLMAKINNRRLVYQIAQECIQWSSETFLKRSKDLSIP